MKISFRHICATLALPLLALTGCGLDSDDSDIQDSKEWRNKNTAYLIEAESKTEGETKEYEKVTPSWMPTGYVLMKWHNDRELTKDNLVPLYNSTVEMIYDGELITGTVFDRSSNNFADAIFRAQPSQTIAGMAIALTNMHVGDSVTAIIPYELGYGANGSGSIRGYSTLIFHMRLKGIAAYEKN